jgi:putative nucleotidyltransferase with HDIG domain
MAQSLTQRWGHVQSVAAKAERLRPALGADADLMTASAWLHDIGYAPEVATTGFHPLDGARYLSSLGASPRLCSLVANHSGAALEAELRGLSNELAEFPDEPSLVRDALWACDMTTSPTGEPVGFEERLNEITQRYGPEHTVPRAIAASATEICAAIDRVDKQASIQVIDLGINAQHRVRH